MISYRETQKFRQLWIWGIILAISAVQWYAFYQQILKGVPFGSNPGPDWLVLLIFVVAGLALPVVFYLSGLHTQVREDGIYVRFVPFHLSFKRISFDEIKSFEVCTYRPIREYGGWGIRYSRAGKAYNVSGDRGVRLQLVTGKSLLIGSQSPERFAQAIESAQRA